MNFLAQAQEAGIEAVMNSVPAAADVPANAPGIADKITQISQTFHIELAPFLLQCFGFAVLAFVIWYFGLKPVLKVADERQQKIADGLKFFDETKAQLAAAEADYQKKMGEAATEAAALIDEARKTAKATIDQAAQDAIAKAEEITKRANENNAREREKMLAELKGEVAQLVVEATAKVLAREVSAEEKSRLAAAAAKAIAE